MKKHRFTIFVLAIIFSATAIVGKAQTCPGSAGCLDTTFGNGGFVATTVNGGVGSAWATAVAIQPWDGKIIVTAESSNAENTSAWDCYVLRYDSNGTLDPYFGNGGVVRFGFTSAADHEWLQSVALQNDGKIIVAAKANDTLTGVARLNSDGTFDPTFGGTGKITFNLVARQYAVPNSIVVHTDGRISIGLNANNSGFGFVRLKANGSFDTTFNGTGKLVIDAAKGNQTAALIDMALQSDGKYLACGMLPRSKGSSGQFAVMRLTSSGALDSSFGSGGKVVTDFGGTWSAARNIVIQSDGKIVAGGDWLPGGVVGNQSFVLIRYLSNGQLDPSFGNAGKVLLESPDFRRMEGMAVQTDGKIVGSGWNRVPTNSNSNVIIFRVNAAGGLDTSFGSGGVTYTDYNGLGDSGNAMATQIDGKFVIAGGINNGTGSPGFIGLYRYMP